MNDWLNHPAIQSGVAPLVAALITAKLFNSLRLSGLAVIVGFCTTVYLVADFNFEPFTVVRKIILCGLAAAIIAPLIDLTARNGRFIRYLITAGCGSAALWVFWPILHQKETPEAAIQGVGMVMYMIWISIFMDRLSTMPISAGAAGAGLGMGVGTSALLATSALLGQLGISLGAACGAYLLIQILSRKPLSCGRTFTLPLTFLCGLIGLAAVLLAKLPWHCLPILAAIPVVAHVPLPRNWLPRKKIIALSILALAPAFAAVFLVWREAGGIPV